MGEMSGHSELLFADLELPPRRARMPHVAYNTGDSEWYTPPEIIERVREVLGEIDLDPASNSIANQVVRARHFFTVEDDGLKQRWFGRVFLNPPYAAHAVDKFTRKLIWHFQNRDVEEAIALVNNATETRWFQRLLSAAACVCFLGRRIRFWRPGKAAAHPLQGQAVVYLGHREIRFCDVFYDLGAVVSPVRAGVTCTSSHRRLLL